MLHFLCLSPSLVVLILDADSFKKRCFYYVVKIFKLKWIINYFNLLVSLKLHLSPSPSRKIISCMIKNTVKKIKRSIENNLNRNGCTVTSNDTFQMFHILIKYQKTYCRSNRPELLCKKGSLKNFAKFTGRDL